MCIDVHMTKKVHKIEQSALDMSVQYKVRYVVSVCLSNM
jgi:hypothetical protein